MRLLRQTESVFGNTDQWKKYEWALGFASLVTGCFSISVVPFLRKDFGERYLGWLNLYFGYSVVTCFVLFGNVLSAFSRHGSSSTMMPLFGFAFIGMSLYRRLEIAQKNNAGIEWHSMYLGTSLLPLPCSREMILKFFEPALVFVAGCILKNISSSVGLWLMLSGLSLLINNHIVFYNERQAILDLRDAQIEAKYFSPAMRGKPARETAGFVVAESSIKLIGKDARLQRAFDDLSVELKSLLDAPPAFSGSAA